MAVWVVIVVVVQGAERSERVIVWVVVVVMRLGGGGSMTRVMIVVTVFTLPSRVLRTVVVVGTDVVTVWVLTGGQVGQMVMNA